MKPWETMALTPWEFNRMAEGFRIRQGEDPKEVFREPVDLDVIRQRLRALNNA